MRNVEVDKEEFLARVGENRDQHRPSSRRPSTGSTIS